MTDQEIRRFVAEATLAVETKNLPKLSSIEPIMFRQLGGKYENMANGYIYELGLVHGDDLPALLTECHRVMQIALHAEFQINRSGLETAWAWIAAAYLVDNHIESSRFDQTKTNDEIAEFLDCATLLLLLLASTHQLQGQIAEANTSLF